MEKEPEASHLNGKRQQSHDVNNGLDGSVSGNSGHTGKPEDFERVTTNAESSSSSAENLANISEESQGADANADDKRRQGTDDQSQQTESVSPEQTYNPEDSPYNPQYQPPDYYSGTDYYLSSNEGTEAANGEVRDKYSSDSYQDNSGTYYDSGSGGEPPDSEDSGDEEEEEGGGPVKPFLEHLEDLRWTLVKSVTAVVLGMLVCLVAGRYLVSFLMWPLNMAERVFLSSKSEVAIMLGTNVLARGNPENLGIQSIFGSNAPPALQIVPVQIGSNTILALQTVTNKDVVPAQKMVVIKNYSPIEGIMVALKLALFGGLVVSFPFVMYFIGQFVLPALHVHEKKILFKAVGFSGGLFLLGVVFCYFVVVVFALGATVQFSQWLGFGADEWRADAYLSFVVKFMLGMGLAFQMPVILLLLVKIGLLDYEKLKNFRTYAFVANLVISAVVTPSGDPFTMLAMALPLHALYEISTFIAWIWHRRELKRAAEENNK